MVSIDFSFKLLQEKKYPEEFKGVLKYEEHEPSEIWFELNLYQHTEGNFLAKYFINNIKTPLRELISIMDRTSWRKLDINNTRCLRFQNVTNEAGKSINGTLKIGISEITIKFHLEDPVDKNETHTFYLTRAGEKVCSPVSTAFYDRGKWEAVMRTKYSTVKNYRYLFTHSFSHRAHEANRSNEIKRHPVLRIKAQEKSIDNICNTADILTSCAGFLRDDNIKIFRYELRFNNELTIIVKERDNRYSKVSWRYNCDRGQVDDFIGDIKIKNELFINRDFWIRCFSNFVSLRSFSPENKFLLLYNIVEVMNDYYEKNKKFKRKINSKKKGFLNKKLERLINHLKIDLSKLPIQDLKILTRTRNSLVHGPNHSDYLVADELNPNFGRLVNLIIIKTLNNKFNLYS